MSAIFANHIFIVAQNEILYANKKANRVKRHVMNMIRTFSEMKSVSSNRTLEIKNSRRIQVNVYSVFLSVSDDIYFVNLREIIE